MTVKGKIETGVAPPTKPEMLDDRLRSALPKHPDNSTASQVRESYSTIRIEAFR